MWRSLWLDILERLGASPLSDRDETSFPADEVADFLVLCRSDHSRNIIKQPKTERVFQSLLAKSIRAGSVDAKQLGQSVGMVEKT